MERKQDETLGYVEEDKVVGSQMAGQVQHGGVFTFTGFSSQTMPIKYMGLQSCRVEASLPGTVLTV